MGFTWQSEAMIVPARHFDNFNAVETFDLLGHARVQVHCGASAVDCLTGTELAVVITTPRVDLTVISQY